MSKTSIGRRARRGSAARLVGWLAVVSMLAVAVLGPSASGALAAPVVTDPGDGNPTCEDLGYSLEFKIDTGDLDEKTYTAADAPLVKTNWDGQEITISNVSDDGQTFDWSSTLPVSAVLVKAGQDNHALYTYTPPVTSDTGLTHGAGQQGISHVTFCGEPQEPPSEEPPSEEPPSEEPPSEEPPSEEPPSEAPPSEAPPSEAPPSEAPPSEEPPSAPPSGSEAPVESETPSFSGGVGGATGTPSAGTTLPPTDGIGSAMQPAGDTWRMLLVVMAGLLASVLVLTPSRSAVKR